MEHISDDTIDQLVDPTQAQAVLKDAFLRFAHQEAAIQERVRTEACGVKLSTLGAVIPGQDVAGAKVYTTINGQFSFVILLFSTQDGRPLASFDAGAITRLRTAACSVLAARELARPESRILTLFGGGVQGKAHAQQFAQAFRLQRIRCVSSHITDPELRELEQQCGVPVERHTDPSRAVVGADIVVTASRSKSPLFRGDELEPGTFVAAVGSSLPSTRELDDNLLRRASLVAVEWKTQALREAGDLVLAASDALQPAGKIAELAELLAGRVAGRRDDDQIMVYKSVGVGLEDVALAGLAWRRWCDKHGLKAGSGS